MTPSFYYERRARQHKPERRPPRVRRDGTSAAKPQQ